MRVLHIAPASGSFMVLLRERIRRLDEHGLEQYGLSTHEGRPGDPAQLLREAAGMTYVESAALTRDFDLGRDFGFAREVFATVRRLQPDVTITYGPKPGAIARPAARLAGSRVVHMHWGNVYDETAHKLKQVIFKGIDLVTGYFSSDVCVENRVDLARLDQPLNRWTNFHYLGNATDIDGEFSPAGPDPARVAQIRNQIVGDGKIVVLLVGRVVVDKGYREFLGAARDVLRLRPELGMRFAFAGRRDNARGLGLDETMTPTDEEAALITDLGLMDHGELPALYAAADIVCLPSYREGFPKSLVEAAAMGKPIVATDIAGCREIVEDGRNGVLIPTRDQPALRDALLKVAESPETLASMGAESRAIAEERFSEAALVERVIAVLERSK